jgi:hypothetical protein
VVIVVDRVGRVRRWARAALVLSAALVAASCSDSSSLGPIAPGHARLSLAPSFAIAPGAPTVPLSRVEGSLTSPTGDSTFAKANFADGQAPLRFDVRLNGPSADFILDLIGYDANGNEAYRAHQVYRIKPGLNDDLDPPVFTYSAADSKAVALQLTSETSTLDAGGTTRIAVVGFGSDEAPITPIRVGFTSRNTDVATVDDAGNVTAKQVKGTTYIVARTPGNLADSMLITARGAVAQIVATPTSLSMFRGATANVATEMRDPAGTVLSDRPPAFASSNGDVATVSAAGVVTAVGIGSANITATVEGKTATVPVTVETPVASIVLSPNPVTLTRIGATQTLTVTITPKQDASTAGLVPEFTSSNANVATVSASGTVTANDFGVATITAAIDGVTATTSVSVVTTLTVSPGTAEKLPKGTQQFTVTSGGNGPFTWQVNGVTGGNTTFGTITTTGFYTGPDAVPSPATFDVCAIQDVPASKGCAKVTINPIPTSGADVIVFNDINFMDNGVAATNAQLYRNMAQFPSTGARSTATTFMRFRGHSSKCSATSECAATTQTTFASTLRAANIPVVEVDDPAATLTTIAPEIKTILLLNPTTPFSTAEINVMKKFASEGGRIIFVGEHYGYYAEFIESVENPFLAAMGAVLRNPGTSGKTPGTGVYACPGTATGTGIRTHQLSTGVTSVAFACSTELELGPNDFAIFTYFDQGAERILVAAAKIDVTPIETPIANRRPLRSVTTPTAGRATNVPAGGPGVPGWKSP